MERAGGKQRPRVKEWVESGKDAVESPAQRSAGSRTPETMAKIEKQLAEIRAAIDRLEALIKTLNR